MNQQEADFFKALTKDRSEIADVLERRAVRGYKDSVVEKYSDQAHFIYELLQNADDALATPARFILEKDKLIFAHNGKRHFSVTNPANEDEDSENKTLGDINSITSIANSNKKGASIGKFGVGFKAVFQYTSTPHIYEPDFQFRIERFIVPIALDEDFPGRRKDETLFVFPFDHHERDEKEAYTDISEKLKNLSYPLLFLTNLKSIEFEFGGVLGLYNKNIKETLSLGNTKVEYIVLTQNDGDDLYDEYLWLFSRSYDRGESYKEDERYLTYSTGFFTDEKGNLIPVDKPAFCYFPTKEVTNLKFIIHAPFLLTDSREGIRAGVQHNDNMIAALSELSADAIEYLRDIGIERNLKLINDDVVTIIPVDSDDFSDPSDKSAVSFFPFYEDIKKKFKESNLLPSSKGYVGVDNAYWASVPQLPQLFSNEQLGEIVDNPDASWVFTSLARDEVQRNQKELFSYIDSIVRTNINEDIILTGRSKDFFVRSGVRQSLENIKGISEQFIEHQPIKWLHNFYKWISETKHRTDIITDKPIFLDQNGKAVAAYDYDNQHVLFLPVENISGYTVINQELLKNKDTKEFIIKLGIKEPSLRDQIYNIILPLYQEDGDIDTDSHFRTFFKYYCECSNEDIDEYVSLLKDYEFLTYHEEGEVFRTKASELYMPTFELKKFFETKPGTKFVDFDKYKNFVGLGKIKQLEAFLTKLGVMTSPKIIEDFEDGYYRQEKECYVDGLNEIVLKVAETKDKELSLFLWKELCLLEDYNSLSFNVLHKIIRHRPDGRYSFTTDYEDSTTTNNLRNKNWIIDKSGEFHCANEMYISDLSDEYELETDSANSLLSDLQISEYIEEEEDDYSNLTDKQREKIEFANKLKEYGIENEEDLEAFREFKRQRDAQRYAAENAGHDSLHNSQPEKKTDDEDIDDIFDEDSKDEDESTEKEPLNKATTDVLKNIAKRTKHKSVQPEKRIPEDEDMDEDELLPSSVDYSKKIERALEKSAAEVERISYLEGLQKTALEETQNNKYSYKWFNTLLEMESINSGESNANSKEVSISFSTVERESGTKRTLVLKHPNRYIPQFMEDLADIPLVLHMGDQTKTVAIEVASIKSYTLRVKMKNASDIDGIDLDTVTSATIDAKSPTFLIEELRKQFAELELSDEYNMQKNLCENIEFVFGPPGTGKTTHLAQKVLIPMMRENKKCKVLVLTPTNKSADVLVKRLMEVSGRDHTYKNWLIRFGATGDEEIEQSPIYRDKTFDIRTLEKNVTVTTIARFPYDFFMPQGIRLFLYSIDWDYIVIDEASMIPIANIVLPLYKKTPRKFIIAGDPFQIEPITSVELWKNENIYTMVHLDSFVEPKTIPHPYNVELLTTQYRSIPDIGYIFSNFAYGGILKHHRTSDSQRQLNLGNEIGIKTLNVIKFPVSKYESIYRCKRLQHSSSYQVYSALFTFEYICYLSKLIAEKNAGELIKIGVIAPYRAQADMIDKLLASEKLPKEIDVQVGTIHGFQGDECDIIFAVFNTPPSISSSKEMFLNKRNIINVSISRARDYLFIVMPDDKTENIENLRLVKRVEDLIHSTDDWSEFHTSDLEQSMFGDSQYLENNAFSTSHQSVNVYGLPEKCYEVRAEDTAIDVQIHKTSMNNGTSKESENDSLDETRDDEYIDSYQLKEELIPEELRKTAIDLPVRGVIKGWCYLVPYEGKVKEHTLKQTEVMFIPLMRNGQEKMVTVSVVKEDRIIYIAKEMFKLYEQGLSEVEGIELRKSF